MSTSSRILALAGGFALALTGQAMATAVTTGGPYIDFKGYLGTDNQIPNGDLATHTTTYYEVLWMPPYNQYSTMQYIGSVPYVGPYQVLGSTTETITDSVHHDSGPNDNNPTAAYRHMVGVSYLTYDPSSSTADLLFTTIYGIDPNFTDPNSLAMTGFNLDTPELTLSGESVLGADGLGYDASVSHFTPIADLPSFLGSGFDLSPFQGDATGGVYIFQTFIPLSAMEVPEPASLSLLALGGSVLITRRRKV